MTGAADPVAAVLSARESGRDIALATSGSTARPRQVVRTTESWWASFPAYAELSGVTARARLWVPGPLAGTMNLFGVLHARVCGATLVDRPGRCTHALLTPAALSRRLGDLPRDTRVTVAGAALPSGLATAAAAAGLTTVHYYGAAELSFVAAGPDAATLRPFPGVEIAVREGVIWARSDYLCERVEGAHSGYRLAGGWASVGDRGRLTGSRLEVTGRPDTVLTAGATVLLADVEQALDHRATCFGMPHPSLGQVLGAAVPSAAILDELRLVARRRLAPSHRPRIWLVADPLPLTPAGKPDLRALAERAARSRG